MKAGLPEGVYLSLRDKIAINDMKKPSSKKSGSSNTEPKNLESTKPAAPTPDVKK